MMTNNPALEERLDQEPDEKPEPCPECKGEGECYGLRPHIYLRHGKGGFGAPLFKGGEDKKLLDPMTRRHRFSKIVESSLHLMYAFLTVLHLSHLKIKIRIVKGSLEPQAVIYDMGKRRVVDYLLIREVLYCHGEDSVPLLENLPNKRRLVVR